MLYGRHAWIVALISVKRCKPEEMPPGKDTTDACAPQGLGIARCVGLGGKDRDGRLCCERRFVNPLCEGIAGIPQILAIEDKDLSLETITSALRFDEGVAGTRVGGSSSCNIAGPHLAQCGLG